MKVLYIVNGLGFSKGSPIGGADKRVSQIGQRLLREGTFITVLTTEEGRRVLVEDGLKVDYIITEKPNFLLLNEERNIWNYVLSFVYLAFYSFTKVGIEFDFVYPSSDYFYDLIPAVILKAKFKKTKLVGITHHLIDWPWQRMGGLIQNILLFVSQRLSYFLFRFFNLIFYPENFEGAGIKKLLLFYGIDRDKIVPFKNGVDYRRIYSLTEVQKRFDGCFLGSLRPSKGIFDLVPIWSEVIKVKSDAKLLVIGAGLKRNEDELRKRINENGLSRNIILSGVIRQDSIFSFVKACRIFICPSYEEGWGIAIIEAMACGLPVVCYDLPAYNEYKEVVLRAPVGAVTEFSELFLNLDSDVELYERKSAQGYEMAKSFDWDVASSLEDENLRRVR